MLQKIAIYKQNLKIENSNSCFTIVPSFDTMKQREENGGIK